MAHLYNLRRSVPYRDQRILKTRTRPVAVVTICPGAWTASPWHAKPKHAIRTCAACSPRDQPKLNLADGSWIGVEALARWQHPVHGLLYPDAFIHIAEGSELALPFTYEVARKAVADCAVMIATMGFDGSLAINIPPSALTEATVPERLLEILSGSHLEPSRLVVEITETSIPIGLALSLDIQTRLRMRGIRLSIDDFGTGHSSLERLHETPFDELKIDMMFVRGAEHNPALKMIAESAVKLGHSLGMVVAAEGVENAEALDWLTRIGCDYAQGYHISRPVPLDALGQWAKLRVATPT